MPESLTALQRVRLDGKFFRVGTERFIVRGVTYGAFAPNTSGEPFPEADQVQRDFQSVVELGANTIRIYNVPPVWLLEAAAARGLRLLVSIPWNVYNCFLDTRNSRREIRTAVRSSVQAIAHHPAVFAIALGNEIPPDVVRWTGARRMASFLDDLIAAAQDVASEVLFTYANYPSTEYLQPQHQDFVTFNVFLHDRPNLVEYLAHLQILAEGKPLVLGECGVDAHREGEGRQAEILSWTLRAGFASGLAGTIVFSFTDEWFKDGLPVVDWKMGLTTVDRQRKPAFETVQVEFTEKLPSPAGRAPRVSIVVASYNGGQTLRECLDSLLRQNHPDYEIIVIDDGSTDDTPNITQQYPQVRTLRVRSNLGLSNARNLGIRAATGEIVAFTDSDCRADPEWLRFLVHGLLEQSVAGIGGPNLLPPEDSAMAALIMVAPGGPVHVLLDDRLAEHVPGCNMAFWKETLEELGGFDPIFQQAGDDVDVCWRLHRRGWQLGFAPAGFVWHHRRSTIKEYLRQQAGYGTAEALLTSKHPTNFNFLGGARWRGRICAPADSGLPFRRPVVYRGMFATGMFQTLYAPASEGLLPWLTSFEYHVLVALPLVVFSFTLPWLRAPAGAAVLVPVSLCIFAARTTVIPRDRRRWWSRPMLALLYYLQPIVRGSARYRAQMGLPLPVPVLNRAFETKAMVYDSGAVNVRAYASSTWRDRREWVSRIIRELERQHWPYHPDSGWGDFDVEVFGPRWCSISIVTVAEATRGGGQTLRCRLRPHWTLLAHVVFWGALILEILAMGVFHVTWKGFWIPLVTLAGSAWFLHHQSRVIQCQLSLVLDDVAREWGLGTAEGGVKRG